MDGPGCGARIAWILKDVADAGWTADEVIAFLGCGDAPGIVHRPSGFLAGRLKGAVALCPTAEGRVRAVQAYRDSRRAERARHQEWEGAWQAPRSMAVRRLVAEAFTPHPRQRYEDNGNVAATDTAGGACDLSAEERADLKATAWGEFMRGETTLVTSMVDLCGRPAAEQVYGADLVWRALRLASGSRSSLMALGNSDGGPR